MVAGIALGAVLASACSLVTSLDGLSDGPDPTTDGGARPRPDAPSTDGQGGDTSNVPSADALDSTAPSVDSTAPSLDSTAPVDAAPGDESPQDGPADTGSGNDASSDTGATFCASLSPQPSFCEDFDEGSYAVGWSYVHTTGGSLALDGTEFRSSPGAMIAQSGIASSGYNDVAGYRSFAISGASTFTGTLELDVRDDQADATGGLAILAQLGLLDGTGGGQYFVQLVALSHGASPLNFEVNEAYFATGKTVSPVKHPVTPTLALGTWIHVTFTVTAPFAGGTGMASLSFNGTQVESSAITVPVKNFSEVLGVGLTFVQTPTNGWTAVYDNVAFTATSP
jgi:hypothetical protein